MTPAARVQSAIEILDQVIAAAREQGPPADRVLSEWFRGHRFAGSKDRRAVRELVYGAIRACGEVPGTGRAAMLRLARDDEPMLSLFDGSNYGPAPVAEGEPVAAGGVAPQWLVERLAASGLEGDETDALLDRAPLDVRVNTLKIARDAIELPVETEKLVAPQGLRVAPSTNLEQWPQYLDGLIEVQDCGSQLACLAVAASPGEMVIDLCAGAGGKTLALAAAMENAGTLIASDTDRGRLSHLGPRAERAGAVVSETLLLNPGREMEALEPWRARADAVLIDAPCSGTGTWRRKPEARWRLTPEQLDRYVRTQSQLIELASQLVRPGGRLIYVTCSLLDEEGANQVERFLAANPDWSAKATELSLGRARGPGLRLTPLHDDTDGFFIARIGKS